MSKVLVKDGRVVVSGGRVLVGDAPCCCGDVDPGGCTNGCNQFCQGDGCQFVDDARGIECIRADFQGLQVESVCPFTGVFDKRLKIIAFPDHVLLEGISTYFTRIPVLIKEEVFRRSTGEIITERVITEIEFRATVGHCNVTGSDVYCPMARSVSIGDPFAGLGIVFADETNLYFGYTHENEYSIGCDDGLNQNQIIIGGISFSIPPNCDNPPATYYARRCGGTDRITVDISQRPPGDTQINIRYQGDIYVVLNEQSNEPSVPVTWVTTPCSEWPIAQLCGGDARVTYDPALRPPDGVTILVFGLRFKPNGEFGSSPPTPGTWTPDPCPGDEPDDPIDTGNADIGDPIDADDVNLNAPDEPNIPQLGNLVEQVLQTVTFNTLVSCPSCQRRKEVLNRYGERVGRAILRRLNW